MPSQRSDARWVEAILLTVALWLFVLLMALPVISRRYAGDLASIALDSSTILVSMLLAMPLFVLFRATLEWTQGARTLILISGVILAATANSLFDIAWTAWVTNNMEMSWTPRTFERNYDAAFRYILAFSVNLALFQLSFSRRREKPSWNKARLTEKARM